MTTDTPFPPVTTHCNALYKCIKEARNLTDVSGTSWAEITKQELTHLFTIDSVTQGTEPYKTWIVALRLQTAKLDLTSLAVFFLLFSAPSTQTDFNHRFTLLKNLTEQKIQHHLPPVPQFWHIGNFLSHTGQPTIPGWKSRIIDHLKKAHLEFLESQQKQATGLVGLARLAPCPFQLYQEQELQRHWSETRKFPTQNVMGVAQ